MPTGAILYVQVPDSTTWDDWNRWREAFLASFDLGLDDFEEGLRESLAQRVLAPDWSSLYYPRLGGRNLSVWEAFPKSVFLEVDAPLYTHYGPGYERGNLAEFVAHAEWFEANIPNCRVWYANDCSETALLYDAPIRAILLDYYQRVGHEPYRAKAEEKSRWDEEREGCWQLWCEEQYRVLDKVKANDGL